MYVHIDICNIYGSICILYIIYYIYKRIIIISFLSATISSILNAAGDLPDLQALPQACSIKENKKQKKTQIMII